MLPSKRTAGSLVIDTAAAAAAAVRYDFAPVTNAAGIIVMDRDAFADFVRAVPTVADRVEHALEHQMADS